MPTLVLPPRHTPDSTAMWRAALDAGWQIERLYGWSPPDWLREKEPVLYGDALWAGVIAEELDVALLEPPFDLLTRLAYSYLKRRQ